MTHAPAITLIIPAYNEADTIERAIEEAAGYFAARGMECEIVVAADGDDGTRERASGLAARYPSIKVLGHRERLGKGRGIREAVSVASGALVGYVDADNKVPIEEFDKIEPWLARGYDLVIGSRAMPESRIERRQPLYRRIGAAGFHVFMQTVVGLPGIRDSQCGFKFFRREAAVKIFELQRIDGYMFDVEILALAQRLGYRIRQVPIRWRDDGDSRLELLAGNLRNVRDVLRIRLMHGGRRTRRRNEAES